ncbi:hypothetical protein NEFER03_1418 [Nematocida sp. LUAm3]|nr:hypothetical protein NEFER03_1418 [Nematocida sp. LUAm3]KAI5174752.1 hypothetical protein NEFER02_0862 [Nematocida sp. LUAm2]KAI5177837.1 hypothetical protein NEFER01_1039 [Nematocida sp. LUAm1]
MLYFVIIGLLIPMAAIVYIRRTQKKEEIHIKKYKNPYLDEYLELPSETSPQEQYKVLAQAASYLLNYEEELEEELKNVSILFYGRMIGNSMWNELKACKEDLDYEKLTIEAELGRFAKISKGIEIQKQSRTSPYHDVLPESDIELRKALYKKIQEKRRKSVQEGETEHAEELEI